MIANARCLLPARLRKTRREQLVWQHDSVFTKKESKNGICFVLNEYSDDPDTSAYMVGQNEPLPMERTEQVSLTPTASATTDIQNTATFSGRAVENNDETWAT